MKTVSESETSLNIMISPDMVEQIDRNEALQVKTEFSQFIFEMIGEDRKHTERYYGDKSKVSVDLSLESGDTGITERIILGTVVESDQKTDLSVNYIFESLPDVPEVSLIVEYKSKKARDWLDRLPPLTTAEAMGGRAPAEQQTYAMANRRPVSAEELRLMQHLVRDSIAVKHRAGE